MNDMFIFVDKFLKVLCKLCFIGIGFFMLFFFVVFIVLGVWQVEWFFWKLDLIVCVDVCVYVVVVMVFEEVVWFVVNVGNDEYCYVIVLGCFFYDKSVLVYVFIECGFGFWVLILLQMDNGVIVYINCGWVLIDCKDVVGCVEGNLESLVQVIGLLCIIEFGGMLFCFNDLVDGCWYLCDVEVMGKMVGFFCVVFFFIDVDDVLNQGGLLVGGLMIVKFLNLYLFYVFIWFVMVVLLLVGGVILVRVEWWC